MEFTPNEIVKELDRYIIGQQDAKRAVAVALRNRYRRSMLPEAIREEITPKNIIMQGPTGVGKTEIARRLAKLVKAPFIKVEATKFTEVGYVGRDVESMIRDLVEVSVRMVKEERRNGLKSRAKEEAEKEVLPALIKLYPKNEEETEGAYRARLLADLREGKFDSIEIHVALPENAKPLMSMDGGMQLDMSGLMGLFSPNKKKEKAVTVKHAMKTLTDFHADQLIDEETVNEEALRRAEQNGIIFIDEIDKIAGKGERSGPDVSREGVQRDILPIVEGCTVTTKYGTIRTDFMLFIASGAFHVASVQDLIPELLGRFPVKVSLGNLTEDDFVKILTQPDNALLLQYSALLKVDKINLKFTKEAIAEIAHVAYLENENSENIGARRLHTVMELLLEDLSFNAGGLTDEVDVTIDKEFVLKNMDQTIKSINLRKYIL